MLDISESSLYVSICSGFLIYTGVSILLSGVTLGVYYFKSQFPPLLPEFTVGLLLISLFFGIASIVMGKLTGRKRCI